VKLTSIIFLLYLVGGSISLVVNYVKADRLARRKLRVVLVGTLAGLLPSVLLVGILIVFNPSFSSTLTLAFLATLYFR
jgi:hypothetical protein